MKAFHLKSLEEVNSSHVVTYVPRYQLPENKAVKIAWVQVAAAVAEAAYSYYQQRNEQLWKAGVSDGLAEIAAKLDQVLIELQRLKVYINQSQQEWWVKNFHSGAESMRLSIEDVFAGVGPGGPNASQKQRLAELAGNLDATLGQLATWRSYGFSGYTAVLSGILTQLHVLIALDFPKGERDSKIDRYLQYFTESINPNNPISLEAARNAKAIEFSGLNEELKGRLNKWWTLNQDYREDYIDRPDRGGRFGGTESTEVVPTRRSGTYIQIHGMATGDAASGFQIAGRDYSGVHPGAPWYSPLPEFYDIGDSFTKSSYYMHEDLKARAAVVLQAQRDEQSLMGSVTDVARCIDVLRRIRQLP
jgi:hypothetical protein